MITNVTVILNGEPIKEYGGETKGGTVYYVFQGMTGTIIFVDHLGTPIDVWVHRLDMT